MRVVLAVLIALLALPALAAEGHAHNDYEHQRPLLDALDNGFASVEADIWLRDDGALVIGHDEGDLDSARTLQNLYLDPLLAMVRERGGIREDGAPLILLIDIKTDGETTYRALTDTLAPYSEMLTRVEDGRVIPGAVTAIVSGNRPLATMQSEGNRLAFYDGRLGDLEGSLPASLMPLVSDNWTRHFSWRGDGDMPPNEVEKLARIVETAHAKGYVLRFWATPDAPGAARDSLWTALVDAGVDLINTDDLSGFSGFAAAEITKQ
jgi:hypothetical protein